MRPIDTWSVTEDRLDLGRAGWRESLFTIGNGYLMTRGSFEEQRRGECRATFINGAFVTPPGDLPLLGAVPDWTGFRFTVDGEPFDLEHRRPAGYRRQLDLTNGCLTRSVLWRGAETGTVKVTFRRIVPLGTPHLAVLEVRIDSLTDDVTIEFQTGLDASVPGPHVPCWQPLHIEHGDGGEMLARYRSVDDAHVLDTVWRFDADGPVHHLDDSIHPRVRGQMLIAVGTSTTLTKFVGYRVDRNEEIELMLPSAGTSFDAVAESSRAAWATRWRASAIAIDGDPEAELAFRYAAFQLIGAAPQTDTGAGIGARIGGFGYRHHVFWDTDVFVAPYFAVTQPDLARAHLGYRHRGLDGARRKASRYGRQGAFYAWESAGTGDEVTPEWSNPIYGEPVRIWTGEIEEHITADVAWSVEHYWRWTGDDRFLVTEGAEMVLEGARYWMSRLEPEPDGLHIRDVIGPDEYHIHVDDNFYTNLMAAWQLRLAGEVVARLDRIEQGAADRLLRSLDLRREELAEMARTVETVVLRRDDSDIWEQHTGFFDLETIDLSAFEPRLHSIYELLGEARMQRTAVIKQPDVLMAMALLPVESRRSEVAAANWAYYAPKADHGSSLSLTFHALLAAQMNDPDLGYELLLRAMAIDLDDSMGNGADGIHTACQGGLLLTALFGFGGLSIGDPDASSPGRLPSHWKSFCASYIRHGELREIEISG